jgi:hypothetical protein
VTATTHSHSNRQLHRQWYCQQNHQAQAFQGHGYALLLDPRQRRTRHKANSRSCVDSLQAPTTKVTFITKHHPPAHHRRMRTVYLYEQNYLGLVASLTTETSLRGCVELGDSTVRHSSGFSDVITLYANESLSFAAFAISIHQLALINLSSSSFSPR